VLIYRVEDYYSKVDKRILKFTIVLRELYMSVININNKIVL